MSPSSRQQAKPHATFFFIAIFSSLFCYIKGLAFNRAYHDALHKISLQKPIDQEHGGYGDDNRRIFYHVGDPRLPRRAFNEI